MDALAFSGPVIGSKNTSDYEVKIIKAPGIFNHTLQPITTTTSIVAIKYNEGVMLGSDVSGHYGSMAMFQGLKRLVKVNKGILMGATGDFADFQYMKEIIDQKMISEDCLNDGFVMKAHSLHSWLTRILYNRRSRFNPLWNSMVVGGWDDGKAFLGVVDRLGMAFTDDCIATGMGAYLALPILRKAIEVNPNMNRKEAQDVVLKCMEVLYYRDKLTISKVQIGVATADGVEVSDPIDLPSSWQVAEHVEGFE